MVSVRKIAKRHLYKNELAELKILPSQLNEGDLVLIEYDDAQEQVKIVGKVSADGTAIHKAEKISDMAGSAIEAIFEDLQFELAQDFQEPKLLEVDSCDEGEREYLNVKWH